MSQAVKVAVIGLDTSHSVEFPRLTQGDAPAESRIEGLQFISCLRFPSAFQAESGQDDRTKQLQAWGVKVTTDLETALAGAEAIMIAINDPALHRAYFAAVAGRGLPIFLDKPLAGNLADARAIVKQAEEQSVRVWSSSSLRFPPELVAAKQAVPAPDLAAVYGPLGLAPAGSSVVWYGVHSAEMLVALMGVGAKQVTARRDGQGAVAQIEYADGRRGLIEFNEGRYQYGGRVQDKKQVAHFQALGAGGGLYYHELLRIRDFFQGGPAPVPLSETLEVMGILEATERSLASGRAETL